MNNNTIFLAHIFSHCVGISVAPFDNDHASNIVENVKLKVINATGFKNYYEMALAYPGANYNNIITVYHYNDSPRFLSLQMDAAIINGNDWIFLIQPTVDEIRRVEGYQYPEYDKYLWFCSDWGGEWVE